MFGTSPKDFILFFSLEYIYFSKNSIHSFQASKLIQPIDDRVKAFIFETVAEQRVTSSPQMKILVENYVRKLFEGSSLPDRLNRRFWPTLRDLQNHINLSVMRLRSSQCDQVCIALLIFLLQSPICFFYVFLF